MAIPSERFGKIFNALTGEELKAKLLADIGTLLDSDDRFAQNTAYPKVAFNIKIHVAVFPAEPATFSLEKQLEYGKAEEGAKPAETSLEIEHKGSGPDAIRQELGRKVPKPTETKHGGIVDIPDEQPPAQPERHLTGTHDAQPEEKPLERVMVGGMREGSARTAQVEIPGHQTELHEVRIPERPVVSVVQRTRAAPEGREVNDNIPEGTRSTQ